MSLFRQAIPYCGPPPGPAAILSRWRLDPIVLALLAAILALYLFGAARQGLSRRQRSAFIGGWAVASLALVSPLCPLSVSLFAARASQHVMLTLVAVPLLAAGAPWRAIRPRRIGVRAGGAGNGSAGGHALAAASAFALVVWFWHAPGPYDLTFASTLVYWTMHVTMIGSALWLWSQLLCARDAAPVQKVAAGLVSSIQMGFLGALITLAPQPLYAVHARTTLAWGLTQLQDQQLGGAIMWIPGCIAFLAVAMFDLARTFERRGWSAAAAGAAPR
ncbi:MAG TPA: cytochrome c oxidase assembly protein [Caulobacteraceae bacterium]|nr:cytochrome c oxidase assembly protein [Caulobacteraceae bacterium]